VLAASKNLRDEPRVLGLEPTRKATVLVTRSIGHLDGRFRVAVRTVATPTGAVTVYAGDTVASADNATRQLATLLAVARSGGWPER
jgi:hypothetical protein